MVSFPTKILKLSTANEEVLSISLTLEVFLLFFLNKAINCIVDITEEVIMC